MRGRNRLSTIALLAGVLVLGWVSVSVGQGGGGAFVPSFNYVISGQWTWTQATPWVLEGATNNDFETSITVTDPTADRTITIPNASGTIALTSTAGAKFTGGTVVAVGASPVSVTTGLATLTACSVELVATAYATNGLGTSLFTTQLTASAGRLDIYRWRTTGVAATDTTLLSYLCSGT